MTVNFVDISGITSLLESLQGDLQKIGLLIAGIAVLALAILLVTGGSQGMQKAKGMVFSILIGVIVLALGITIITSIYNSV